MKSPPSLEVRPTSDRLRETLFNVISSRIAGARFLDLCAGSGAVGIEALSRDAEHVTFVDSSRKMTALIEANLDLCRIARDERLVVQAEATAFLEQASRNRTDDSQPWDIIFFDPPYANDYLQVLEVIAKASPGLVTANLLLIVEHHHKKELPDELGILHRTRVLKQGDSALSFYGIA